MNRDRRVKLSRRMSYLLRHNPAAGNLRLDERGCVDLGELAEALGVPEEAVREVVARDPKGRFVIERNAIRATYGHSIDVEAPGEAVQPPAVLYHGTPRRAVEAILREGLRPMGRQMVHLSVTRQEARVVGRRRDTEPAILRIDARAAHDAGIEFRRSGSVYLAPRVPPEFIAVDS